MMPELPTAEEAEEARKEFIDVMTYLVVWILIFALPVAAYWLGM